MTTHTVELNRLNAYSNDADELRRVMDSIPDGATYTIHKTEGDRPWESDSYSISFSWLE